MEPHYGYQQAKKAQDRAHDTLRSGNTLNGAGVAPVGAVHHVVDLGSTALDELDNAIASLSERLEQSGVLQDQPPQVAPPSFSATDEVANYQSAMARRVDNLVMRARSLTARVNRLHDRLDV